MSDTDFIDRKLEEIGGFGRYQLLHATLIALFTRFAFVWQTTVIVYTGYFNNHHCTIPENRTKDEWIPQIIGPDGDLMYDQCYHYDDTAPNQTVACENGWSYEPETFHPTHGTVVMEWDLVCSRSNLVEISIVCLNVGCCVGTFIVGPVGDRFGRRLTFFLSMALLAVSGIGTAFSPNITVFCILSFVRGISVTGVYTQGTVLGLEIVPKRVISFASPLGTSMTSIGQMALALLSYFITQWRYLQLTISLISVLFLLYYRWCPESLHWLHQKGRTGQLDDTLTQIARFNKISTKMSPTQACESGISTDSGSFTICQQEAVMTISGQNPEQNINNSNNRKPYEEADSSFDNCSHQNSKILDANEALKTSKSQVSGDTTAQPESRVSTKKSNTTDDLRDFLRRPKLVLYLAISCFLAFVVYSSYFGLVYMQGSLTGSVHLNMTLSALLGLVGLTITILLSRKIGRRPAEAVSFSIFGFFMLSSAGSEYINVPGADEGILATVFAMAAKLGEASSTAVFNFFCLEFFPTNIRSTAAGMQTSAGYLGSIISPFVSLSLIRIAFWIPGVVYGALAFLAAALTFLLPETRGRNLPKTADEVEAWPRSLTEAEKLRLEKPCKKDRKVQFVHDNASADNKVEFSDICRNSCDESPTQEEGNLSISTRF